MNKLFILTFMIFSFISCKAQNEKELNLSNNIELNYIISSIIPHYLFEKQLWGGSQFIKIFKISDSKATPEGYFEGFDGVLESLLISSMPDGDYYTNSKLYKIEGLHDPIVIEVNEGAFPEFSIKIEFGFPDNRKTETFNFEAID